MPRLGWTNGESEMGLGAALGNPRFANFSVWIVSLGLSDVRMDCSTRRSLHLMNGHLMCKSAEAPESCRVGV